MGLVFDLQWACTVDRLSIWWGKKEQRGKEEKFKRFKAFVFLPWLALREIYLHSCAICVATVGCHTAPAESSNSTISNALHQGFLDAYTKSANKKENASIFQLNQYLQFL